MTQPLTLILAAVIGAALVLAALVLGFKVGLLVGREELNKEDHDAVTRFFRDDIFLEKRYPEVWRARRNEGRLQ